MRNRMGTLLFVSLGLSLTPVEAEFRAGAAVSDITPRQWPLHLRGSFRPRLVESAHDPLNARALVLGDGATQVALVVVDSCMVERGPADRAKARASEETGIPVEHMLVAATHTHSAPFANASHGTPEELAYQKLLIEGIADSIIRAQERLESAQAGWAGETLTDEVFNRRWFLQPGTMPENPLGNTRDLVKMNPGRGNPHLLHPAGPIDPEVSILSVRDARGRPLCLLGNYALHYVGRIPGGQASADYFGEFARLIGVRLRRPEDSGFVGMLSNGTSGDINNINFRDPRPPREPFEQVRIVASKVADAAYHAYGEVDHRGDLTLAMAERELTLRVRVPHEEDIERAKGYLAAEDEESVPRLARSYARRILELAKLGETVDVTLQALRIGDLAICAIPFEVFAEIGLELKTRSPFDDTFVIELANGAYGYLPTPTQHQFGGYETWLSTNRVQKDASVLIVRELLEMMEEL